MRTKNMTRAQAQRIIAGTTDIEAIKALHGHPNKHIKAYVDHKVAKLEAAAALKAKRSEASKKAAATRKAKKAVEVAA